MYGSCFLFYEKKTVMEYTVCTNKELFFVHISDITERLFRW